MHPKHVIPKNSKTTIANLIAYRRGLGEGQDNDGNVAAWLYVLRAG
jgi:hypothetical protein